MGVLIILSLCVDAGTPGTRPNGRYTMSIAGPSAEETIVGPPGSLYDDGTLGAAQTGCDYYTHWERLENGERRLVVRHPQGHNWHVLLKSEDPVPTNTLGVHGWEIGIATEGPLRVVDATTDGTVSCYESRRRCPYRDCMGSTGFFEFLEFYDPVPTEGPNANITLFTAVSLSLQFAALPGWGTFKLLKLRVFGRFPENEGETARGRIYLATWTHSSGELWHPGIITGPSILVTEEEGNPPLTIINREYTLKASSVGPFIRGDANDDGRVDLSDSLAILGQLFLGDTPSACLGVGDTNGDGAHDITDAIYVLSYLYRGTAPPPHPFPRCDRVDIPVEDCPPDTTSCRSDR